MKTFIGAVAGVAVVCIAQISLPYYSIYEAKKVVASKDAESIKSYLVTHVNFDPIKKDLTEQVTAYATERMGTELEGNPFAGLAFALVPKLSEGMVASMINPTTISKSWAAGNTTKFDQCMLSLQGFGKAKFTCPDINFRAESSFPTWKIVGVELKNLPENW